MMRERRRRTPQARGAPQRLPKQLRGARRLRARAWLLMLRPLCGERLVLRWG